MNRLDMTSVKWYKVKVLGKMGFFTDQRINRKSIPDGWYFYEVRHADNDWCEPVEVALGVLVNFMGTLIISEPILRGPFTDFDNTYKYVDADKDWKYLRGCAFMVKGS